MAEQTGGRSGAEFPQYCIEADRLKTFRNWPSSNHQQPKELAEAGFFFQGVGDIVKCYSCGVELSKWTPEDDAWAEHERFQSTCEHVLQHKMGVMNLGSSDVDEGFRGCIVQASDDDSDGMMQYAATLHRVCQSRVSPIPYGQVLLSERGAGDIVTCHSCGVELSRWTPEDEAWAEHERFQPTCEHVLQHRMGGMNLGNSDVDEVAQGHSVEASGGDNKSIKQRSEEDIIQEEKNTSRERNHETIEEELQRLRHQFACKTCFKEKASMVILPCTHLSACPACVEKLQNCNVCHQPIKATVKAYCA